MSVAYPESHQPSAPPSQGQGWESKAIQIAADNLVSFIEQQVEQAVALGRDKLIQLEQQNDAFRALQSRLEATHAKEKGQLSHQVAHLTHQLAIANTRISQLTIPPDARIRDLEAQVEALLRHRELLESRARESTVVLKQLGIESPMPGIFRLGNQWDDLLKELGLNPGGSWSAEDLDNCVRQMVHQLVQRRLSATGQRPAPLGYGA